MQKVLILLILCACIVEPIHGNAQVITPPSGSSSPTLEQQYQEMINKAENYNEYKVIKGTVLSQYSKAVQDSIAQYQSTIATLQGSTSGQANEIQTLKNEIATIETKLTESEKLRNSLSFLGIPIGKAIYHTLVWIIIAGLGIFGSVSYTSYVKGSIQTKKASKEMQKLEMQMEEYRKTSNEKQMKLARDLQTERNLVEELKAKLKDDGGKKK